VGGILNINKPENMTSSEVVRNIKKILEEKVGHAGTLDPMAKGVLVVLFGSATVYSQRWMDETKTYWGQMKLGIKTDTGDRTGKIIQTSNNEIDPREIPEVFSRMCGEVTQISPAYSSVKWRGIRSYKYARQGIPIPRIPRIVTIHSLDLLSQREDSLDFRVVCSKGTYIRSLVEELGEDLGTLATLSDLVRERVGSFTIQDSLDWNEISRMNREQILSRAVQSG